MDCHESSTITHEEDEEDERLPGKTDPLLAALFSVAALFSCSLPTVA
jgi:hypothetical protein